MFMIVVNFLFVFKRVVVRNKLLQLGVVNGSIVSLGLIIDEVKEDEKEEVKENEDVDEVIGVEGVMKSSELFELVIVFDLF